MKQTVGKSRCYNLTTAVKWALWGKPFVVVYLCLRRTKMKMSSSKSSGPHHWCWPSMCWAWHLGSELVSVPDPGWMTCEVGSLILFPDAGTRLYSSYLTTRCLQDSVSLLSHTMFHTHTHTCAMCMLLCHTRSSQRGKITKNNINLFIKRVSFRVRSRFV